MGLGGPDGRVNPGETPGRAAARELEEEAGWRAGPAAAADAFEAARSDCVPLADVPALIAKREISSIITMAALLHLFAVRPV